MTVASALGAERHTATLQPPRLNAEMGLIQIMLLRLGIRWFALDVRAIVEVALKGAVTRVPTSPSHVLGVTCLRGRLVTVVSLEQMIGGAGPLAQEKSVTLPRLVVVRDEACEIAVVAEQIHGLVEHVVAPELGPERSIDLPGFVAEEFDWKGNRVYLLDVPILVASAAQLAGIFSLSEQVET
jgi:chemotaxis signal transduction protein